MLYKKYIKRILDLIFSLIFLIILIPILLIESILIILIDRNKIIFKQLRTGKDGKDFYIYKFSTYKNGNVTKLGKILRMTSVDEFPQLINIIKGDMSFIGPRPWVSEIFCNMNEEQRKVVSVLPGLTGLAQINGRKKLSIFDKINYDLEYIDNLSFLLDLKIILKTFKIIICKEDTKNVENNVEKEINDLKKNNNVL